MKNLQFCLQLLRANVHLFQRGLDVEMPNFWTMDCGFGICNNLNMIGEAWPTRKLTEAEKQWMEDKFKTWPQYSGYRSYPVEHPFLYPDTAYNATENLWVGEYGSNRIQLLDYLLEQLANENIK